MELHNQVGMKENIMRWDLIPRISPYVFKNKERLSRGNQRGLLLVSSQPWFLGRRLEMNPGSEL